ncbi:hypothetical protein CLIB1444_03S00518 [[Candida] jaroonii]|uniref:Uncharacterized protein n=1 Tax=[Candida] jaroonii TaxID=467808 RepID=A0ACA9Y4K0_9ASCO|nr:hypothetical protein CLIB1444_03S00518 [[Candida] jaroonii]
MIDLEDLVYGETHDCQLFNDAIAYLRLLTAYKCYEVVDLDSDVGKFRKYVKHGTRRFVTFVETMKEHNIETIDFDVPLDILLVWNVVLLYPSISDEIFSSIGYKLPPFPLSEISTRGDFELDYDPAGFEEYMEPFECQEDNKVPIYCPVCKELIDEVDVEDQITSDRCSCDYPVSETSLKWMFLKSQCEDLEDGICELVKHSEIQDVSEFMEFNSLQNDPIVIRASRFRILQFTPLLYFPMDLPSLVHDFSRFYTYYFDLDLASDLSQSVALYNGLQYWLNFKQLNFKKTPTLELEFFWQVELLCHEYKREVEEGDYLETAKSYREKFDHDLSLCPCITCSKTRGPYNKIPGLYQSLEKGFTNSHFYRTIEN